jgi:hypothetical protein
LVPNMAIVSTFTRIAKAIWIPSDYACGHVRRVSSARHLARVIHDLWLIHLMARSHSYVVLRYIQEAPLHMVTTVTKGKRVQSTLDKEVNCLSSQVAALSRELASMRSDTLVAFREILDCRQKQVALPPLDDPDVAAVSSCRVSLPVGCWKFTWLGMTPHAVYIGP